VIFFNKKSILKTAYLILMELDQKETLDVR